jgi:hypothetical protein
MQRSMLRMTALIEQRLVRFLTRKNRNQYFAVVMVFAKVAAKPTIPTSRLPRTP